MIPFLLALACVLAIPVWMIVHGNRQHTKRKKLDQQIAELRKRKPWSN